LSLSALIETKKKLLFQAIGLLADVMNFSRLNMPALGFANVEIFAIEKFRFRTQVILGKCLSIGLEGVVTLPTEEREGPADLEISSRRDRLAPRVHRRGAEGAVRCSGGEVALDVEGVEDGGMSGEKSLC
jgi:hypothetical protein